jgi:hypothetical protein
MKPELKTKRDAAITTHEENVRARAYEQGWWAPGLGNSRRHGLNGEPPQ